MKLFRRISPLNLLQKVLNTYGTPSSISSMWNFGMAAGLFFGIQFITGLLLVTYYHPTLEEAAFSIDYMMRDVHYGWLIRFIHMVGASFFFLCVYVHVARGLHHGSYVYPRVRVWLTGVIIFFMVTAIAFCGYILPWGQMSYWGATVITNLLTVLPNGEKIVTWVWGGSTIRAATLSRFFTIHFVLPFILAILVITHIALLHNVKSGSTESRSSPHYDLVMFGPIFSIRDILSFGVMFIFFNYYVHFAPLDLAHPDNFVPANPLSTPAHITPEWYFLPMYAVLRSMATKVEGVLAFVLTLIILVDIAIFSIAVPSIHRAYGQMGRNIITSIIMYSFLVLMFVGASPAREPFLGLGEAASFFYFFALACLYYLPIKFDRIVNTILLYLVFIKVPKKGFNTYHAPITI